MVNRTSAFIKFWKFFPTPRLIGPPRLFDFGLFSYLHIIRTPRLLETLEYKDCESLNLLQPSLMSLFLIH